MQKKGQKLASTSREPSQDSGLWKHIEQCNKAEMQLPSNVILSNAIENI